MNRGIPVVFESLAFHAPWNFCQVKTLETSRIMEFHRIFGMEYSCVVNVWSIYQDNTIGVV